MGTHETLRPAPRRTMAFYRRLHGFTGGHLKVWHYFGYVAGSDLYQPEVFLTDDSRMDDANPWMSSGARISARWNPAAADALFVGGLDWRDVPHGLGTPVLNLVQSVRHTFPDDPRYPFLRRRAYRVAVNDEISSALISTGIVNGPIVTIPVGIDLQPSLPLTPWTQGERPIDVLILGRKNPSVATDLRNRLVAEGIDAVCLTANLPRAEFLARLGQCRVAVTLPMPAEGFFLVPMEAMASGCFVVCPNVPGLHAHNEALPDLRPSYTVDDLANSVRVALQLTPDEVDPMRQAAVAFLQQHSLQQERSRFLEVLAHFSSGDW